MLLMFLLAAAAALPSSQTQATSSPIHGTDILRSIGVYSDCVTQQTLRLGAKNHESAETILMAVRSLCASQRQAMVDFTMPSPVMLEHITAKAENDAVAALLEARLKTP